MTLYAVLDLGRGGADFLHLRCLPGSGFLLAQVELQQALRGVHVLQFAALLAVAHEAIALGVLTKPLDMDRVRCYLGSIKCGGRVLIADDDPDFVAPLELLLSEPITFFYVNDDSLVNDEYTTAIGNDANTGIAPDSPKASIRAI